jgi:hypothetical protein
MVIIKQKQPLMPISVIANNTYMHGGLMITIGTIPQKLQRFFKPVKKQVFEHVYHYFWSMVLSICISHALPIANPVIIAIRYNSKIIVIGIDSRSKINSGTCGLLLIFFSQLFYNSVFILHIPFLT